MGSTCVELRAVRRRFGDVEALADLGFEVPTGTITVLLGPNGAGKTTAIRVITGALTPDTGTVAVFGLDPSAEGEEVRRRCGVVTAKPSLYDRLSGWDNLRYAAQLYGLGRGADADRRIEESAARFGIERSLGHEVGGYSTGMKTRLALARAVLHDPELLLLDEPTSGLDPESALAVLELIRTLVDGGKTVVLCTHLLLEAEGLADQIVIMEGGACLVAGPPAELASRYWPVPTVRLSAEDGTALDAVADHPGVVAYRRQHTTAVVDVDHLDRVPELVVLLATAGARLTRVEPFSPSLEDLYFAVRRQPASPTGPPAPVPGRAARRPAAVR